MSSKKNVDKKKKEEKDEEKKKKKNEAKRKKRDFSLPPQPKNFKQIEFNKETGKLYLVDYNNDIFECNIFGEKNPQFHIDITGTSNYTNRVKSKLIEELKLNPEPDIYFPQIKKFEGYFPYPRPLSLPFINEVYNPKQLISEIHKEKRYENSKIKKIFELKIPSKDNKCLLTYMTSTLSENDSKVQLHLIKLINEYIEEKIKENPYNENFINKDHSIIALRRFKKILQLNLKKNEINGKLLPLPKKEIKAKFDLIKKVIKTQGWKKMHIINENVNFDIYKDLYSIKTVGKEDYILKPDNLKKLGNLDKCENVYEVLLSRNKKNSTFTSPNKTDYTLNSDNSITNQNQTKTTGFDSKFQTARTFYPNKTFTHFNFKDEDRENLSILSDDENIKIKKKEKFYKTFYNFKKENENENRLLKGFQYPFYKEPPIYFNKYKPKLKTPGEIYVQENELLKKVNPIAFKREEQKDLFDLKILQKKKQNKLIYERIKIKK
jgi:hypothetical protein